VIINAMTICSVCGNEIPPATRKCDECGSPVSSGHTTISHPEPAISDPSRVARPVKPRPGTLALYIMGEEQPLLIRDQGVVNLGRFTAEDRKALDVDLTPYQAHVRGVSRHHAQITSTHDGYSLMDLNSSNGTWINEQPLTSDEEYLLSNGDMIRLGQLVMFIYYL
jgi:hypothetical protein